MGISGAEFSLVAFFYCLDIGVFEFGGFTVGTPVTPKALIILQLLGWFDGLFSSSLSPTRGNTLYSIIDLGEVLHRLLLRFLQFLVGDKRVVLGPRLGVCFTCAVRGGGRTDEGVYLFVRGNAVLLLKVFFSPQQFALTFDNPVALHVHSLARERSRHVMNIAQDVGDVSAHGLGAGSYSSSGIPHGLGSTVAE